MQNNIHTLFEQGQSIWCDNISRGMIDSGELNRLIELGIVGVTSNPSIFMKAITKSNDYDSRLAQLLKKTKDDMELYEGLVLPDIADAADILKPVYDETDGIDGYVSLEVNPKLAYDTQGTIAEAIRLFQDLNRPNIFIKVPATEEGIPAIEALIAEGISVNVTLIFSTEMYEKVMLAYMKGLEKLIKAGGDPRHVTSVASFFVSRVDSMIDKMLEGKDLSPADLKRLSGKAANANARIAYAKFLEVCAPNSIWGELASSGAHLQRPLWASTSTKNPEYPDTMYVDNLVGQHTVNTLPPQTIDAVLDHASTKLVLSDDVDKDLALFEELDGLGISIKAVTDQLLIDGVKSFDQSFDELLANIAEKKR